MSHDLDYVGEDYRLTLTCVEMFIFYDFVLYFLWILNLIFFFRNFNFNYPQIFVDLYFTLIKAPTRVINEAHAT